MNREEKQVFQNVGSAPFWQDKHAQMRVPAAIGQSSPVEETAREEQKILSSQYLEPKSSPKQHSTKRQTVQAAGWIDHHTNLYINNRLAESRKLIDPKFTRSKVIAEPAFLTRDLNVAPSHLIASPHHADVADGVGFAGF